MTTPNVFVFAFMCGRQLAVKLVNKIIYYWGLIMGQEVDGSVGWRYKEI